MSRLIILIVLIFCAPSVALCDTPCPSVSNQISILEPTITNSPTPVALANYDLNTKGLSVQYAGNHADYFVGVPNQAIVGHATVPWTSISSYPRALVQEKSTCPILLSNGTPLLTTGNMAVTTSPFVLSPCPADTGTDTIQVVSLVQAPLSIYRATYDMKLQWLFVQFADAEADIFVGVPSSAVSGTVTWNSLSTYSAALVTQGVGTTCPLLVQP